MTRLTLLTLALCLAQMTYAQSESPASDPSQWFEEVLVLPASTTDCEADFDAPEVVNFQSWGFVDCTWEWSLSDYVIEDACETVTVESTVTTSYTSGLIPTDCTSELYAEEQFSMLFLTGFPEEQYLTLREAVFIESGTDLTIQGQMESTSNPNDYFDFQFNLENRMNWENWSDQSFPTGYKDDLETGDNYLDWEYMILNASSWMTGHGTFEGSQLNIHHAPPSMYYAVQLGEGASNANTNFGLGGWFEYSGELFVDGALFDTEGNGDIFFDLMECSLTSHTVELTLTDACDNTSTYTQTLYSSSSAIWDGSCPCSLAGCQNPEAENYDAEALLNDYSCFGCFGDLDDSGAVGSGDMLVFVANYLCQLPNACETDLDNNGITNARDGLILLGVMGNSCN